MSQKPTVAILHKDVVDLRQNQHEHGKRLDKLEDDFAKLDKSIAVEFAVMKEKQDQNYKLLNEIKDQQVKQIQEPSEDMKWLKRAFIGALIPIIVGALAVLMNFK